MGSAQFEVVYDHEVLELKAVEGGESLGAVLLEHNGVAKGRTRIALASGRAIAGDVRINLTFGVKKRGESDLGIEEAQAWTQADGLDILLDTEPGRFTADAGGNIKTWWLYAAGGAALALIGLILVKVRGGKAKA